MITLKTTLLGAIAAIGVALASYKSEPVLQTNVSVQLQLIDALDGSGTVKGKGWQWPGKEFYEEQITILEQHGGGTLEVYNFSQAIPTPIIVKIEALKTVPNVYAGETEVKKVKQENENIRKRNDIQKAAFWARMQKEILSYIPQEGSDFSYVQSNVSAINKSLRLPQYNNYQRHLLIYSDLLNDEPGKRIHVLDSVSISRLNESGAQIAICSFVNNKALEELTGIPVKSPDDFIGIINSFFKN